MEDEDEDEGGDNVQDCHHYGDTRPDTMVNKKRQNEHCIQEQVCIEM